MKQIGIDLCSLPRSDDGYVRMVAAVDYFSKCIIAKSIPDKTADTVASFLFNDVYTKYGAPSVQINDQGREFVNRTASILHDMFGVKQRITSAYHPQANGLVVRNNRTIQTSFLKVLGEHHGEWLAALNGVCVCF